MYGGESVTLSEFWNFVLSAEQEYSSYRKQIMKKFSLSAAETDVLMFLANNPEFDTAAQVARLRKIPKSQVSLAVNALFEKKLLSGSYGPSNKKSIHLTLTEEAKPVVAYGSMVQEEFGSMLFAGFTAKELEEFGRLHGKLAENIEKKGKKA